MTVKDVDDKRCSRRAFFTLEDHIAANILSSSGGGGIEQKPVPVTLLSISVGGLSVTARRFNFPSIKVGDHLTFTEIQAPQPLGTIVKLEAVVKYVIADNNSVRMALGCEFEEIPDSYREKIDNFVKERLKAMGLT